MRFQLVVGPPPPPDENHINFCRLSQEPTPPPPRKISSWGCCVLFLSDSVHPGKKYIIEMVLHQNTQMYPMKQNDLSFISLLFIDLLLLLFYMKRNDSFIIILIIFI